MPSVYYNEFNKKKCQAMALLMAEGLIPHGDIDDRPIQEVTANDVKGYTQCHFFAGWGGWAYALGLAGWPDGRPVWTGSCPCQPFSSAGRQKGKADERHLWPEWLRLIRECGPSVCFGEQVERAIAHGWLDDVYQGLEREGYAVGSSVLPACGVGAPHRRERLWFVGIADSAGSQPRQQAAEATRHGDTSIAASGTVGDAMAHAERQQTHKEQQRPAENERGRSSNNIGGRDLDRQQSTVGDGDGQGPQRRALLPERPDERSPWSSGVEWLQCADGKQRLVKPGIQLLADGYPNRGMLLHIAGDSIVPQVAAAFIGAYMDLDR